jgi:polar amino acid transport system substrate-binding protein
MRFHDWARRAAVFLTSAVVCAGCGQHQAATTARGSAGGEGAPVRMSSTADLKDKRIGVLLGSVHDTLATKNYPNATILQYESSTDLALGLMTGKVDAALSDVEPLVERMRTTGWPSSASR